MESCEQELSDAVLNIPHLRLSIDHTKLCQHHNLLLTCTPMRRKNDQKKIKAETNTVEFHLSMGKMRFYIRDDDKMTTN